MEILRPEHLAFLQQSRRAVLGTVAPTGAPRLVPVCFAVIETPTGPVLVSPLDEKPKRGADPHSLARVRDLLARPSVSLLADRWDEDWSRLAWLRVDAVATIIEPGDEGHGAALLALRARYEQYAHHRLEALPIVRLQPTRVVWWSAADSTGPDASEASSSAL